MSRQEDLLKQRIRDEYKRCSVDCVHFFRKYGIIQHPVKGKIPFDLYPFQEKTLGEFQLHKYTIVLKGRQLGLSTLVAAYALWKMIFVDDYRVLVIATTQEVSKELVTKVQLMYSKLPVWIRKATKQTIENRLELGFANGSSIKAVSSSEKSARSPSISLLLVDECAFVDHMESIWTAALPTLALGGSCILISTPNGMGNMFHREWLKAIEGNHEDFEEAFNPIKLPWDLHPDRDVAWGKKTLAQSGKRRFAQEFDCDFQASGHTVVEGDIIQWYKDNMIKEPLEKRYGGDFWVWKYPNYNVGYMLIADVARGDGGDYSAFHIFEIETMEQVAEYKSKIGTRDYGNMLVGVATEWNNALLVIDNKNIGWDVVQCAIDRNYPNLFYSYKMDSYYDDNIHLRKNHDLKSKKDKVAGFTTTQTIRMNMISKLEMYTRDKSVIIRGIRTMNELMVFIWQGSKPQAQRGYNDDLVSALGMGLFIRDTAIRLRHSGIELSKRALKQTHRSVYVPKREGSGEWEMSLGATKGESDLRWLL